MSVVGKWRVSMNTPVGTQQANVDIQRHGSDFVGTLAAMNGTFDLTNLHVNEPDFSFTSRVNTPMGAMDLSFKGTVEGDTVQGTCTSMFGDHPFTGSRQ